MERLSAGWQRWVEFLVKIWLPHLSTAIPLFALLCPRGPSSCPWNYPLAAIDVLRNSTWLMQLLRKNLPINPPFRPRPVWNARDVIWHTSNWVISRLIWKSRNDGWMAASRPPVILTVIFIPSPPDETSGYFTSPLPMYDRFRPSSMLNIKCVSAIFSTMNSSNSPDWKALWTTPRI